MHLGLADAFAALVCFSPAASVAAAVDCAHEDCVEQPVGQVLHLDGLTLTVPTNAASISQHRLVTSLNGADNKLQQQQGEQQQ
jgi:hypothetical protein